MTSTNLIDGLRKDVLSIIEIAKEFELLPDSVLNWKERPEKWSMLECFEHLNRYSLYYNNAIGKAIAHAAKINGQYEVKSTWMGKKFIAMMHPDNKARHKTFARMNPIHSSLKREVIYTFTRNQREMLVMLDDASGINLNNASIPVEFFKLFRMNLGDAFKFVIVHEQRHLQQADIARSNAETVQSPALKI